MNQLRREKIGKYIQEKGAVTVKELSALFPDVSLMTIHRDLEKLEQEGVISRTRGGAVSTVQGGSITEAKLEARMHTNMKAKREMAAKALTLIEQGSAVFLDAGTSSMALAQALPGRLRDGLRRWHTMRLPSVRAPGHTRLYILHWPLRALANVVFPLYDPARLHAKGSAQSI